MNSIYRDYARLLIDYCLDVKPGQNIFVRSGYLAEPLLREIYREILPGARGMMRRSRFRMRTGSSMNALLPINTE
jgi:leucyl aminopeptidase (aminopeptidase T)